MSFLQLVKQLMEAINFDKSKIVQPRKFVFVCGGQGNGASSPPIAMREILLAKAAATGKANELGNAEVVLAEDAVKALEKSSFRNLLDLEKYIAAVVRAIILIVESPGSMCELGAFVTIDEIAKKLIIIIQGEFKTKQSFITSGAIRYFEENESEDRVLGYDWSVDKTTRVITIPDYAINEMMTGIADAINDIHSSHSRELFNRENTGHLIYLTLAYCHLFRAIKFSEIKNCFEWANIEIDDKTIKRSLDVLAICRLILIVPHGPLNYYVTLIDRMPIDIAFQPSADKRDRKTSIWINRIVAEIKREERFRIDMFTRHNNA